jgi:hypothetical protein
MDTYLLEHLHVTKFNIKLKKTFADHISKFTGLMKDIDEIVDVRYFSTDILFRYFHEDPIILAYKYEWVCGKMVIQKLFGLLAKKAHYKILEKDLQNPDNVVFLAENLLKKTPKVVQLKSHFLNFKALFQKKGEDTIYMFLLLYMKEYISDIIIRQKAEKIDLFLLEIIKRTRAADHPLTEPVLNDDVRVLGAFTQNCEYIKCIRKNNREPNGDHLYKSAGNYRMSIEW